MSNEKKDSVFDMVKLGLILVCYAVASCTVLAIVNSFTAPKIQADQLAKANTNMKEFFPEAEMFVEVSDFDAPSSAKYKLTGFNLAVKNGECLGGVVQVSGPTFDKGKIIIGVKNDNTISGMKFLELSDSAGFGSKAKDENFQLAESKTTFYGQFTGKDVSGGFENPATFEAISGATVTSNGAGNLVHEGTKCIKNYLADNVRVEKALKSAEAEKKADSVEKVEVEGVNE